MKRLPRLLVALVSFAAGIAVAITTSPKAQMHLDTAAIEARYEGHMRFEAAVGTCRHHLAPDSSWSYREWGNYDTRMQVAPRCAQIGISVLPFEAGRTKWGVRAAYVDHGTVTADNTYPVDEPAYFRAKDTRTAVQSATGRFQGSGHARGFTLGLAAEQRHFGLDLGVEAGVALLRTTWHVPDSPHMATTGGCRGDWACADCVSSTWYAGVNARWENFFISIRRYANVHASQASRNPLFIGPTDGPVNAVLVGITTIF